MLIEILWTSGAMDLERLCNSKSNHTMPATRSPERGPETSSADRIATFPSPGHGDHVTWSLQLKIPVSIAFSILYF